MKIGLKSRTAKAKRRSQTPDKRKTVSAKFRDLNSGAQWSGRGKAPKWVLEICSAEKISLEKFKQDGRFKVR